MKNAPPFPLASGAHSNSVTIMYIFCSFRPSVRPSVCSRLTFYWKKLRSFNMAQNFRLLAEQIIGYLSFFENKFLDFFLNFFLEDFVYLKIIRAETHK
jgi:hypothetical protein